MKKGIIALFIVLALLVVVSPGIIGMLAEKSVDEQIEWAETENTDLRITAVSFDRGWFSSQGQHRIELRDSTNATAISDALGFGGVDATPVLIIDTALRHGPIARAGAGADSTSLAPGLGSAESTLSVEMADGEIIELPGVIYSSLALNGDLSSSYVVAADSNELASWGDIRIDFESTMANGAWSYDGSIPSLQVAANNGGVDIADFLFSGELAMSEFGFAVGDMLIAVESLAVESAGQPPLRIGPVLFETHSAVDGQRIDAHSVLSLAVDNIPGVGEFGMHLQVAVDGIDGAALHGLVQKARAVQGGNSQDMMSSLETQLLDVFAAGADIRIERLDVELPQGTIKALLNLTLLESDRGDFGWTSLLLSTEADAKIEIPEVLANMAMLMVPNAELVQGFLIQNGDVYEVEAAYKQGLLTVNGLPLPIPVR